MDSLACVAVPAQQLCLRAPWKLHGLDEQTLKHSKGRKPHTQWFDTEFQAGWQSQLQCEFKLNMRDTAMVIFRHTRLLGGLVTRNKAVRKEGR